MMKGKERNNRMDIRILGIMISCLLLLCSFSLAEGGSDLPASDVTETEWVQVAVEDNSGLSDEELAAGYINQILSPGTKTIKRAPKPQGQNLTGANLNLYLLLRQDIADIASGVRTSTEMEYSMDQIYPKLSCTAAELGVESIPVGYPSNEIRMAATDYFFGELRERTVVNALLADCPYDLYWFDKTAGYRFGTTYGLWSDDGVTLEVKDGMVYIDMTVSQNYALGEEKYTVDPKYGQGVQAAAENAQAIVDQNEGLDNYDRLLAYKDAICGLVSYNDDAANASNNTPYGDPWQLIWVFDGDDTTNVVCEGYAKAFKYLNDLSAGSATVITVDGQMDGGAHMWNIVTVDGRNYMVDVTNCDSGTIGYPEELFMVGSDDGDIYNGYHFKAKGQNILYEYNSFSIYSNSQLTISDIDYLDYTGGQEEISLTIEPNPAALDQVVQVYGTAPGALNTIVYYHYLEYPDDSYQLETEGESFSQVFQRPYESTWIIEVEAHYEDGSVLTTEKTLRVVNGNHLVVLPEEGSNSNTKYIYATVGDTITMQPYVTADDITGISYQWYSFNVDRTTGMYIDEQVIEGATGNSYTVESYTGAGNFYCRVSDQHGNTKTAFYRLYVDNHLNATVYGTNNSNVSYRVEPGASSNLKVQVNADDMSDILYQWYRNDYDAENDEWHNTRLEGETGDSYTAENITSRVQFSCEVTDRYGSKEYVYFIFYINTDLEFYTNDETTRMVNIGDVEQLTVTGSCSMSDIHYHWYKNGVLLEGETGTEITTEAITEDTIYRARVADDYGNSRYIDFRLLIIPSVSEIPFIGLDTQTTAEISSRGKMVYFRFVPDETYEYVLYSVSDSDTYGYLYDGNMNLLKSDDDGGENTNFRLSYTLQAGNTYVFAVRFFSTDSTGSFPIILTRRVDNHLSAWVEGEAGNAEKEIYVNPGERVEMKVSVSADDMSNLKYRWEKEYRTASDSWRTETLTNEGEASWTLENAAATETYFCTVSDQYGNTAQVIFRVDIENHLMASVYGEEGTSGTSIPVALGDSAVMRVMVTADDLSGITYSWMQENYNEDGGYWDRITLAENAGDSWTVEDIRQSANYICVVSDRFGNTREVWFDTVIENHMTAQAEGSTYRFINSGENAELSVTASCDDGQVLYQWFRNDSKLTGETGASISLTNVTANARYRCEVRDQYNNNASISFQIFIAPDLTGIPTISPDTTTTASVTNGLTYFRFVPAESGRYVFTSDAGDDTYGYLFDGDLNFLTSNDDGGENYNFRISYELQGGQTYYYAVRFYDMNATGSFPVLLTMEGTVDPGKPCGENCTWTLQEGILTISGSGEMYDYATGNRPPWRWEADTVQAGAVIGVENIGSQTFWFCTNMTDVYIDTSVTRIGVDAFHGCTALMNVHYDGTPEMWEAIEIEAGNTSLKMAYYGLHNILTLPAGLQVIESEAFAGLPNADAIRIPASVTDIAEDAFDGTSAVILAPAGSYAAQWAADRGLEYIEE